MAAEDNAPLAEPGTAAIDAAPMPRLALSWWLSALVIAADQISKAAVRATVPLFESRTVIPNLLDFTHVRNTGLAYGVLNDVDLPHKSLITVGLAALALGGITLYARHLRPDERLARLGLSLILGGALGNLADRVFAGYVVDFVDVYWRGWHFWAFNLADTAITIGAVLVFCDLLFGTRHASHSV